MKSPIGKAEIVTIALSPECCGGWDASLKIFRKLDTLMNLGFDSLKI